MFAPRSHGAFRQASNRASQCLRQQRLEALRQNPVSQQMRQQRCQSTFEKGKKPSAARILFRAHPFSVSLAGLCILAGASALLYGNYIYHSYIIGAFHTFPEAVAKPLRRAIYYTNYSLDPKNALKYYKMALQVADEIGFDPFSDEMIGVKIQVATLFEKIEQYDKAIGVLEIIKSDNLKWMEVLGDKPGNEAKRTRVLRKTVQVSVKLGDLYACPYILDTEKAEECLVWAVETVMREKRRVESSGVEFEKGDWLSDEEQGAALETLAHHYEEKDHHYLAAPLFLQAITFSQPVNCHTTVLMNNLSISLAQQLPPPSSQTNATRTQLVSNAKQWAEKAISITAAIKDPERTEECDVSCAVATHNLGEFAEMLGDVKEARKRFVEAMNLAQKVGFKEGVVNSGKALRRLDDSEKKP
ncbi:TPR repeat-containing protein [Lachnellula occidentalis]|uniref:TPR repeat-containing protein n=1 Tax=Lachnellula occidentalis TaxID=215460 RepID=A0A8H8RTL5_9HELO|nr:TPR repeat-containing protein [Lachnellula occidentalis]